jgi:hypothetical protein
MRRHVALEGYKNGCTRLSKHADYSAELLYSHLLPATLYHPSIVSL